MVVITPTFDRTILRLDDLAVVFVLDKFHLAKKLQFLFHIKFPFSVSCPEPLTDMTSPHHFFLLILDSEIMIFIWIGPMLPHLGICIQSFNYLEI